MPRTTYQTCEKIIKLLISKDYDMCDKAQIERAIKIVAGAQPKTIKRYWYFLTNFCFLKKLKNGIYELIENPEF